MELYILLIYVFIVQKILIVNDMNVHALLPSCTVAPNLSSPTKDINLQKQVEKTSRKKVLAL